MSFWLLFTAGFFGLVLTRCWVGVVLAVEQSQGMGMYVEDIWIAPRRVNACPNIPVAFSRQKLTRYTKFLTVKAWKITLNSNLPSRWTYSRIVRISSLAKYIILSWSKFTVWSFLLSCVHVFKTYADFTGEIGCPWALRRCAGEPHLHAASPGLQGGLWETSPGPADPGEFGEERPRSSGHRFLHGNHRAPW